MRAGTPGATATAATAPATNAGPSSSVTGSPRWLVRSQSFSSRGGRRVSAAYAARAATAPSTAPATAFRIPASLLLQNRGRRHRGRQRPVRLGADAVIAGLALLRGGEREHGRHTAGRAVRRVDRGDVALGVVVVAKRLDHPALGRRV